MNPSQKMDCLLKHYNENYHLLNKKDIEEYIKTAYAHGQNESYRQIRIVKGKESPDKVYNS